jgi:hypothetical protein
MACIRFTHQIIPGHEAADEESFEFAARMKITSQLIDRIAHGRG